jgi:hypothetical protein
VSVENVYKGKKCYSWEKFLQFIVLIQIAFSFLGKKTIKIILRLNSVFLKKHVSSGKKREIFHSNDEAEDFEIVK